MGPDRPALVVETAGFPGHIIEVTLTLADNGAAALIDRECQRIAMASRPRATKRPQLIVRSPIVGLTGQLIWTGVTAAFTGIVFTVTYYDLRAIKESVDFEQITAVFD